MIRKATHTCRELDNVYSILLARRYVLYLVGEGGGTSKGKIQPAGGADVGVIR